MSWLDIKQEARAAVHVTFGIPAQFRPKSGGAAINGSARLHYKMKTFGDLDREGFATVTDELDYVIIDTRVFVGADEDDRIFFPDLGRIFQLEVMHPSEDNFYVKWEVKEK